MNNTRIGRFTSSEIWKLTTLNRKKDGFGAPALTYIEEKKMERRLGRPLQLEKYSRSSAWGNFVESLAFSKIPLENKIDLVSDDTLTHPDIPEWAGTPDLIGEDIVGDIKCFEPTKFCRIVDSLSSNSSLEHFKKEFKEEFWQLVSNAIIAQKNKMMLVVYMPYRKDLNSIREMLLNGYEGDDIWKYRFIAECDDYELPYIPDNNEIYKDLNIFEYELDQDSIEFLTNKVNDAITEINS